MGEAEVALAFRWVGAPAYARLAALARGIVEALPMTLLALGFVATTISPGASAATRSTSSRTRSCDGPMPSIGEISPPST